MVDLKDTITGTDEYDWGLSNLTEISGWILTVNLMVLQML